jgi:hypothetical protein
MSAARPKLPKAEADKRETFLIWRAAAWARVRIGVPYLDSRRSRSSVISSLLGRASVTKAHKIAKAKGDADSLVLDVLKFIANVAAIGQRLR